MLGIGSKSVDSLFIKRSKLHVLKKKKKRKAIKGQIQQEYSSCGDQENLEIGGKGRSSGYCLCDILK